MPSSEINDKIPIDSDKKNNLMNVETLRKLHPY